MNGACKGTFLAPPKGQISFNICKFQLLSQFQRLFNQTLCFFSQMKDINISDGIIIWSPGSCPRGMRVIFSPKFNQNWCASYLHEWHMQWHHFWVPVPWGGAKRSNIIKSELQSQFQRFLNQILCIFSQIRYI